jgi:peptidoglycan/xylan/chitin deacetylase (PgdA/CDA1 family)
VRSPIPRRARRRLLRLLATRPGGRPRRRVVVLLYHSVHPTAPFASVSPAGFDRHLEWLRERCRVVPFDRVLQEAGETGSADARPVVAITFDDGYADNHQTALPLLVRHGLPATFFLSSGLIERDPGVLERLCRLQGAGPDLLRPLSWGQVRELRASGMEIGGHTYGHADLARAGAAAGREVVRDRELLRERLGEDVTSFAFPFGKPRHHVDAAAMDLVAACGYRRAAAVLYRGVRPGDSPFAVPRFAVTEDSLEMLRGMVLGRLDLVGAWHETAPAWLVRRLSPETTSAR